MALYRVTLEFQLPGRPPTQDAVEHLLARLRAVAPGAHAVIELGIGRLQAGLTVRATDADDAIEHAVATSRQVFGRAATRIEVVSAAA